MVQLVACRALDRGPVVTTMWGLISPSYGSCGQAAKFQLPWWSLAVIYVYTYNWNRVIGVCQLASNKRLLLLLLLFLYTLGTLNPEG